MLTNKILRNECVHMVVSDAFGSGDMGGALTNRHILRCLEKMLQYVPSRYFETVLKLTLKLGCRLRQLPIKLRILRLQFFSVIHKYASSAKSMGGFFRLWEPS